MVLFSVIFVSVFLVIAVVMAKFYFTDQSRMTSSTTGLVVEATDNEIRNAAGRYIETKLVVRYVAGGAEHRLTKTLDGTTAARYPAGRALLVRYNPAVPDMADLAAD